MADLLLLWALASFIAAPLVGRMLKGPGDDE